MCNANEKHVCMAIQEMKMESERNGERNGELKKAKEMARILYEMGDGIEKISICVGYAAETVRQWLGLSNG